ncbi:transposase TnpA, Tn21 [Escherichia coli]|uniref:Transposase TnpA, Tn21 n=1 Tax=Escherichia coli TaxID=562 RepID=A0A377F4E1_ECOLX|nr:transposase TnpA, Tn21 [Escherichia coli]
MRRRGHTADFGNAVAEPGLVASVIITDQLAPPVTQEGSGVFACTAGCEVVNSCLQVGKRCGAVGPDVGLVVFFLPGASMLTGVSSACRTLCSSRVFSTHPPAGCNCTPQAPTHRPGGARISSRHGRTCVPDGTAADGRHTWPPAPGPAGQRWDAFVDHLRCTGAWINVSQLSQPICPGCDVQRWHCCKVSDEAAFCLIQSLTFQKTLLTRRISPRGSP